jgi:hypothetical protein
MPARTTPLRADLEHVVAGRNFRFSVFQISGGAKSKLREGTQINIRATPEPIPGRIHFGSDISGYAADGSGPGRVRIYFGWTNPLPTLAFYNEAAQIGGHLGIIEGYMFRDRLRCRPDRGDAKIIPLQIFGLQGQLPSVRLSVNQWVPGSSPGRGANFLFQINHLLGFYAGIH